MKELACKILAMYEEKKIGLKPDHFDSRGNSPYDGAAALSQIRDTCYGNKVQISGTHFVRIIQVKLSEYGNAPGGCVCLKEKMLQTLHDLAVDHYNTATEALKVGFIDNTSFIDICRYRITMIV